MSPTSSEKRLAHESEDSGTPPIGSDAAGDGPPPIDPRHDHPFTHGFFDKDPGTVAARSAWIKTVVAGIVLVICVIWAVLSMYWAALGRTSGHIHNLSGYVVDFDGGQIGQAVTQTFADIHSPNQLTWLIKDASEFPNGPSDVAAALLDDRCWAAIAINPGASNALNAAVNAADASYNTSQAVTAYTTTARNENIYRTVISQNINTPLILASQNFALQFSRQLAARPDIATLLSTAPGLVTRPLYYIVDDLRPFDVPVAAAVDFVGLIYLLILALMMTNQLLAARVETGLARRLTLKSLILMRLLAPCIMYFPVTLMYGLLSQAFGVPFNRTFGHAGFVIYWMMSWCGMMALGLALESVLTLLTNKFLAYFLVLWIITNVSVSFYPIEVLPTIFRYGYAMPFYNVSKTVRTIVFNTKNQVGLNFGVQIAWIIVSCITLPFFQWFHRRREVMLWKKEQMKYKLES
ncbi:hypothetical protein BJ138DRAFT_1171485 [Hygrophoropsis aurantiaca]|uniref:Uncharacterized protein n=1 Tax=Hygrophoropsis aurantiaca TaxID=72124 RepID=A0ACB8AJL7_9AGAM|nr:hypothetical protein BJ138DRAFT_1171485 [Hygrophoropsis aurantiaca]